MNERLNAIVGARIAEFKKKMASVKKTIRSIPKNTVTTVTVVTDEAYDRIGKFQGRIAKLANSIRALGTVMGNMAQGGLLIASPSIVPIIASATGALGALGPMFGVAAGGALGLGSAFTSAAGGLGGYALVANHAIGRIQALSSAISRGDVELSELPGYYQKAMKSIEGFEQVMFELRKEFTKPITETLTTFIQAGTSALDQMKPAIKSTVGAVDNLANSFKKAVNGSGAQKFFEWMGNTSGTYVERFGKAIGNLIAGFGNLMVAFDPLADSMSSGFMDMTKRFSEWTSKLSESEKFQSFISFVQTNGPKLLSTLSNVRDGLVGMFSAFGPLSADMMTGLQNLTERFKEWGQSLSDNQQFQKFIGYIRDNAPTVISLIGNIATFLVNLGIAIAPIGAKVLELVNSFFAWTSSMMEAHPWVGKLIAVGVMLAGAFMAVIPLIIALRTAFAGLPGVIIGAIGKLLPVFSSFKNLIIIGLRMLATNTMTTAIKFGSALSTMMIKVRLWGAMILAQIRITLTNWIKSMGRMIASAATSAAKFAVHAAKIIGRWALIGAKSLFHAARVAAAWFIALGPVGWVIATVIALVALIIANWEKVKKWTSKIWSAVWGFIKDIASKISNWVSESFSRLVNNVKNYMNMARDNIQAVWDFIKNTFQNSLDFVLSLVKGDFEGMKDAVKNQMDNIKNTISDIWGNIKDFFANIDLSESGKKIINSLANGITAAKDKVVGKVKDIAQSIRDFWPFSPPKTGPLTDLHKIDFGWAIGKSIDSAKSGVARSMASLAAATRNAFAPDIALADIGGSVNVGANIQPNTPFEFETFHGQNGNQNNASGNREYNMYFNERTPTPSEAARKVKQLDRELAMRGGF